MPGNLGSALETLAGFVTSVDPPPEARSAAVTALMDTVGVALAGSVEPVARAVQRTLAPSHAGTLAPSHAGTRAPSHPGTLAPSHPRTLAPSHLRTLAPSRTLSHPLAPCPVWGTSLRLAPSDAALANGTAAHALDYDDMCFVSLAHPSAPLVPAALAAGLVGNATGRAVLDAYVIGFEVQARLGRLMNPRHYQRGWHCTSTLGALSSAAAAARLLGLDKEATAHALAIAASSASGLKENFGTMVKPLHAGLAARDGVLAAMLAQAGLSGSVQALDGPQGFLEAFDSEGSDLAAAIADLGSRWEILETGITVKLYPSCAGTHPTLDAVLDLRAKYELSPDSIANVTVEVDPIVPTILIYDRPRTALEAKFSMPFCVATALVDGAVNLDTFDDRRISDDRVGALMERIAMRVDEKLGEGRPALTASRVRIQLRDGREISQEADGARGYPAKPASAAELESKFISCASRAVPEETARALMMELNELESVSDVKGLFL